MIKIWNPRWHDKKVLIAKYKVQEGVNDIMFTKSKKYSGAIFSMTGDEICKYPLETNGSIPCYAVALYDLTGEKNELQEQR